MTIASPDSFVASSFQCHVSRVTLVMTVMHRVPVSRDPGLKCRGYGGLSDARLLHNVEISVRVLSRGKNVLAMMNKYSTQTDEGCLR